MFPLLRKYPVQIFNWHAFESLPGIHEAQVMTGKCIMAGLERMDITDGHKNEIEHQIYETLREVAAMSFSRPAASSAIRWIQICFPSSGRPRKK